MKHDLVRPCPNCPFRTDVPGYLRRARAQEIAMSIANGSPFPCHETTVDVEDEDGNDDRAASDDSQFCAGALIVMEHEERPNQYVRIAERLGMFNSQRLDMDAPVHKSFAAFVFHHGDHERRVTAIDSVMGDTDADDDTRLEDCCEIVDAGCEAPAGYMAGGIAIPADNEGVELHHCPECGRTVCDNCSDEEGVCIDCAEYAAEDEQVRA